MEKTGKIVSIGDTQQITEKFSKRQLVISFDDGYRQQFLPIDFLQNSCLLLDNFQEGDDVTVSIDLGGNQWRDSKTGLVRYFPSVVGWRISSANVLAPDVGNAPIEVSQPQVQTVQAPPSTEDDSSDLPF